MQLCSFAVWNRILYIVFILFKHLLILHNCTTAQLHNYSYYVQISLRPRSLPQVRHVTRC
jgi:hypothetical protein